MSEEAVRGKKDRQYSGPKSVKFWKRVNTLRPKSVSDQLYVMGCQLQTLEGKVLEFLERHEARRKP